MNVRHLVSNPYSTSDVAVGAREPTVPAEAYLSGTKPLWKAFWIVLVLGNVLLSLLMHMALAYARAAQPSLIHLLYEYRNPWWLTQFLFFGTYASFAWVSVWRCARNTGAKYWSVMAKVVVVLHVCWLLWFWCSFAMKWHLYG